MRATCERLPLADGSVDAVVTDPPYGVNLNPETCGWDVWPDPSAWAECWRVVRDGGLLALTIAPHVAHERIPDVCAAGWRVLEVGAWVYGNGRPVQEDRPKRCWDVVYFFGKDTAAMYALNARGAHTSPEQKGRVNKQTLKIGEQYSPLTKKARTYVFGGEYHPANVACEVGCEAFGRTGYERIFAVKRLRGAGRIHETEKPVALVAQIVKLVSEPGDLILDPFGGSGSTAAACIATARRYVYGELLQDKARTAAQRLANQQPPLFAALGDGGDGADAGGE